MNKLFLGVLIMIMGCDVPKGSAPVGIKMSAQSAFCSGNKSPFAVENVQNVRVIVTGKETNKDGTTSTIALTDHTTDIDSKGTITVPDITENTDACLTLMATMKDGTQWYARHRHINIKANKKVNLDMVLNPYGRFVCLGNNQAGIKPVMFPVTASLTNGQVLIAGGFTKAVYDKTAHTVTLSEPSRQAYIYDPFKGTFQKVNSLMTEGRAAFAMVDLNVETGEQVVLFGGAKKITMLVDSGDSISEFPLQWTANDALDSYEVFDVAGSKFIAAGNDVENNAPKKMLVGRVFPRAVALHDNTVLITGGGLPPRDKYEYTSARIYSPYEDKDKDGKPHGNFQAGCSNCLNMQVQRNGQAIATIVTTGMPKHLIIGGTTDPANFAEVYTESSLQKGSIDGAFKNITFNKGLPLMYFPTLSPIGDTKFLLTGGLNYIPKTKSFKVSTDVYYILTFQNDNKPIQVEAGTFKGLGRFFHQAHTMSAVGLVAITGGFNDFSGIAKGDVLFYNITTKKFTARPATDDAFNPIAGFAGMTLPDDTLMFVGGIKDYTGTNTVNGLAEIYTSSSVPVELYK